MKKPIKMLMLGDSKAGKTGALASLLLAGYTLRVIDMDNGTDIVEGILKKSPEALSRLHVRTCTDGDLEVKRTLMVGGKPTSGVISVPDGTAWDKAMEAFYHWPEFGAVNTWQGEEVVFVLDSLSFLSQAAMSWVMKLNGRLGQKPFDTDFGDAQTMVMGVIRSLFSTNLKCHVIVITHIDYRGGSLFKESADKPNRPAPTPDHIDLEPQKGYPMTVGKALNNVIGRNFNTLFLVKSVGAGSSTRRVICTRNTFAGSAQVDLASVDLDVPPELPIETGLAEYFRIVRGDLGKKAPE